MTSDQDRDESYRHNDTYDRLGPVGLDVGPPIRHPHYQRLYGCMACAFADRHRHVALMGDEVALQDDATLAPVGLVTAIYPEAVEVSTGDDYKVADLVLLRRAQ